MQFIPQSGTKDDDPRTRKAIRRHVMLGKNEGRPPKNPKQPKLQGTAVFHVQDPNIGHSSLQQIPRRVGSEMSCLVFADDVAQAVMNETLQFCKVTNESLYVLEPCIDFNLEDTVAMCLPALAYDTLYLNVMVFTTQVYMDLSFRQATSKPRRTDDKAILKHYGRSLSILRARVAQAERQPSDVSDLTIMAVLLLALHAVTIKDDLNARCHAIGLSRLVNLRNGGITWFTPRNKQMIEILRCDLSVSLATGHPPLFFQDDVYEYLPPLPDLGPPAPWRASIGIFRGTLSEIWDTLGTFCDLINNAHAHREKISERLFLDAMASTMYRLSNLGRMSDRIDEAFRLAMLAFSARIFLQWRGFSIPLTWLVSQCVHSVVPLIGSPGGSIDASSLLWLSVVLRLSLASVGIEEFELLDVWLAKTFQSCHLISWDQVKSLLGSYLWIDIICDRAGEKLYKELWRRAIRADDTVGAGTGSTT